MRIFLFFIFCFFALQINSCSLGTLEAEPGATKGTIQNSSVILLQDVRWNNTDFGDIEPSKALEKEVQDGVDFVYFKAYNKQYRTWNAGSCKKYRTNNNLFRFTDDIIVISGKDTIPLGVIPSAN